MLENGGGMKAVMIGAGSEALHTIQAAHDEGLYVTALDGNPDAEGLKAADKGLVVDISDERAAIEAVQREAADFVLTGPIGRYLTTAGAVNDALRLPGISRRMAVLCTDKYRFHQTLKERGLRDSRCYAIDGTDERSAKEIGEQIVAGVLPLNYPAILKPRFGSGSRGIRIIGNEEELRAALRDGAVSSGWAGTTREAYVLEECAAGEEYGVDGAVIAGRFYMVLLRKKENTPFPARQAVGYFSVSPDDAFWRQARLYMEKVAESLGLGECLLHADLIRRPEGPFAIEVSARPSGHNLHNLFTPFCTGVDMAAEYIRYRMGRPWNFTPDRTRQAAIHYFDMQGRITRVPDEAQARRAVPALAGWECHIREGEELPPVSDGHSLMGRGFFMLEGSAEELREKIDRVKALFEIE